MCIRDSTCPTCGERTLRSENVCRCCGAALPPESAEQPNDLSLIHIFKNLTLSMVVPSNVCSSLNTMDFTKINR